MKSMFAKPWASVLLLVAMIALAVMVLQPASAAIPGAVKRADGTAVFGMDQILSVKKDFSTGDRTAIRYSSGVQYVKDDAAWSKYAKVKAYLGTKALTVAGDPEGLTINIAASNGVWCSGGQTVVAYPQGPADYLADSCTFFDAVKNEVN